MNERKHGLRLSWIFPTKQGIMDKGYTLVAPLYNPSDMMYGTKKKS